MKLRRFTPGICLAVAFFTCATMARAQVSTQRQAVDYPVPYFGYGYGPGNGFPQSTYWWPAPYVMPLPAYGILPPPLATYNMFFGSRSAYNSGLDGTGRGYGGVVDPSIPPGRTRDALYPAIPFEGAGTKRLADLGRVRYEIGVPKANAIVLIDGAKTKQTGRTRVFVTPPLAEGKQYTVEISVHWTDENGDKRVRQRTFTVVAGETVKHTFTE